jgi:hypothetical protein
MKNMPLQDRIADICRDDYCIVLLAVLVDRVVCKPFNEGFISAMGQSFAFLVECTQIFPYLIITVLVSGVPRTRLLGTWEEPRSPFVSPP